MPIFSDSPASRIKDTSYTQTRIPHFPEEKYEYGNISWDGWNQCFYVDGILRGSGVDYMNLVNSSTFGVDSFGSYGIVTTNTPTPNYYFASFIPTTDVEGARFFRKLDPELLFIFKLNHTSNDFRFAIGLSVDSIQYTSSSNDPFYWTGEPDGSFQGFALTVRADENFKIVTNDGSAIASTFTSDIDILDNTEVHYFYIKGDSSNARWCYSWDKGAMNYISSNVPTDLQRLSPFLYIETLTSENRGFTLYNIEALQKRFV